MPFGSGIVRGMALTLKMMFTKPITIQYPDERRELPERTRGALYLPRYDDGRLKCRACLICVKACPDGLLDIPFTRHEDGTIMIDDWRWESQACMFCGICRDSCPYDALAMSKEYELSRYRYDVLWRSLTSGELADRPVRERPAREKAEGEKPVRERPTREGATGEAGEPSSAAEEKPAAGEGEQA